MAQPLLHHGQHLLVVPALGIKDAARAKARLLKAGGEKVAAAERPQHGSRPSRGDARREQGGGRLVAKPRPGARHLVQRGDDEAAARQPPIDRIQAEGKTPELPGTSPHLQRPHFGA